ATIDGFYLRTGGRGKARADAGVQAQCFVERVAQGDSRSGLWIEPLEATLLGLEVIVHAVLQTVDPESECKQCLGTKRSFRLVENGVVRVLVVDVGIDSALYAVFIDVLAALREPLVEFRTQRKIG